METDNKIHQGRNIRRLRDMLGIKQETIASEINMTQQNFSKLEQKKEIDEATLEKVAEAMHISTEVIKRFNEDGVINFISNTLHDNSGLIMYNPTFNAVDKIVELYEKLLAEKDSKIEMLVKLMQEK